MTGSNFILLKTHGLSIGPAWRDQFWLATGRCFPSGLPGVAILLRILGVQLQSHCKQIPLNEKNN